LRHHPIEANHPKLGQTVMRKAPQKKKWKTVEAGEQWWWLEAAEER